VLASTAATTSGLPGPSTPPASKLTSRSTNGGQNFADTISVHNFYPGLLTLADPPTTFGLSCMSFKTDCWNTAGLIASNDGGTTWHLVKLLS
jgi:hypothetical protein